MLDNIGYYGLQGKTHKDEDIIFRDGMLTMIFANKVIGQILCSEYHDPVSLKDISDKHPTINKLIYEDALTGVIFNYMNHPEIGWETIGKLLGYA